MSYFIREPKVKIHTLKKGDPGFQIQGDFMVSDRASIEIDPRCPSNYATLVAQLYEQGWIKPVAHVTEQELIFIGLKQE